MAGCPDELLLTRNPWVDPTQGPLLNINYTRQKVLQGVDVKSTMCTGRKKLKD
jgi:hypothetical protein